MHCYCNHNNANGMLPDAVLVLCEVRMGVWARWLRSLLQAMPAGKQDLFPVLSEK